MKTKGITQLLDNLKLSNTNTVYFFEQKSKWGSIVPCETKKKIEKIAPDAFYVFNKQPYILFFDLSESLFEQDREDEIHKQVWSFDQSPIIFIIKDKDIEIFNAFSYEKEIQKLERINLKGDENRNDLFSFWNLQSGTTWKWLQNNHYTKKIADKRVNQKLFENIRIVREILTDKRTEGFIEEDEANIMILRLIFVRYLIDRGVKLDQFYIAGDSKVEKKKNFINLIEKPRKLNEFFAWLNGKFNGVLFKEIKVELTRAKAKQLATVFAGESPDKGTLFYNTDLYFEIFDFSIIPVEVISGIYEALISEENRKLHSAVYTPSFLVEYILTNTVDVFFNTKENKQKSECRIFDPSVGSGIFLVQAFRRMVDKEISISGKNRISRNRLREIVYNNLFGIDINEQALKVTCFSIYIAMLDYFEPNSILPDFKFPDLIGRNLFAVNFFDTSHIYNTIIKNARVDFILGNPPWKSDKDQTHINWLTKNNKITGRFEIAQSFLLRSKDFMEIKTNAALIVTSTIFYNISTTTKKFKQDFLTTFCIDRFFDLSAVRRLIFEEKNNPCSIAFYRVSDGSNYLTNVVRHSSIKSNLFLKHYKALVIEKFDQKEIQQKHFIENDWMFKVALYGSTLDFGLLKKIEKNKTKIIDLIDNVTFYKGSGIERGAKGNYYPKLERLPIIENKEITPYYSNSNGLRILSMEETFLSRGRRLEIFTGSKILFKEQNEDESEPLISFLEIDCVFRKGISSFTSSDIRTLKTVYGNVISNLYTYFLFIKSCSWGISTRPQTRLDEEYLSFPFLELNESLKNKLISAVDDFLDPYKKFYNKENCGKPQKDEKSFRKINTIIEELYSINAHEKDVIDYVLDISRYQFQENKQDKVIRRIDKDETFLVRYANVFIKEFKGIYEGEYLQIEVYPLNHFIVMNFEFTQERPKNEIEIVNDVTDESEVFKLIADNISISNVAKDLYIQKDIKGYEENSFYIIKPNELKCWHRAMAWYDVAEIKKAIEDAEIHYLKNDVNGY